MPEVFPVAAFSVYQIPHALSPIRDNSKLLFRFARDRLALSQALTIALRLYLIRFLAKCMP